MWMMGYNEGGADSFNGGRKLRPLMPRLSSCPSAAAANTNSDHHRLNMAVVTMTGEQNKRELMMLNSSEQPQHPPVMVSSRWNPTPDQLRVLEELYRQGTRTPSADHIQQITSQLRRYGKIEGKNVFYWFQNHKARERQKRRRQMESNGHEETSVITTTTTSLVSNHGFDKKDSPGYKVDQTKEWICSVGCDTQPEKPHGHDDDHHEEEPPNRLVERNGRCGGGEERRSFLGRNATWQMMQLPPGFYPSSHYHQLLNSTTVSTNMSNTNITAKDSPLFLRTRAATNTESCRLHSDDHKDQELREDCSHHGDSVHQEHTLELFPLSKEGFCSNGDEKDKESGIHCFYEFLPLKN